MKISLVLTTFNRNNELERLFNSIVDNNYSNIEIVIIDQNPRGDAKSLVNTYSNYFSVIYIYSEKRLSLSEARNIGLSKISGDIVGFPDDDCWYSIGFFDKVVNYFRNSEIDAILTSVFDPIRNKPYGKKYSEVPELNIHYKNSFKYTTSVGIFYRTALGIYKFDEEFGVGARWMGGEDIDYVLNLLYIGFKIKFVNETVVYHEVSDNKNYGIDKMYNYSKGFGAVLKKSKRYYNFWGSEILFLQRIFKSLIAALIFSVVNKDKFNLHISKIKGTINGYKSFN